MPNRQHTFIMLKPDLVKTHHVSQALHDLSASGIDVITMKLTRMSRMVAMQFYEEHQGKGFFEPLVDFMASGPLICIFAEGFDAVSRVRDLLGASDPKKALPGTLRKKYGTEMPANAFHASDSPESAKREIEFAIEHGLI